VKRPSAAEMRADINGQKKKKKKKRRKIVSEPYTIQKPVPMWLRFMSYSTNIKAENKQQRKKEKAIEDGRLL
jgi:hypothetical protein